MRARLSIRVYVVVFLALGLLTVTPVVGIALDPGGTFVDDNDSIHEGSVEAIADAGITKGCNPPVNDLFCPLDVVTREQMATFLVRALDLPAAEGSFVDTAGSVHEADIGALAAAGITKGCNPPTNDMFCPKDGVTREQMASFLTRALDLTPIVPPDPLPDESPSELVVIGSDSWLFFAETVQSSCIPQSAYDRALLEIAKAKKVVANSGRDFVYTVVPDKASIYHEYVPGWDGDCDQANSYRLRQSLAAAADPARVELWEPFLATDDQLYFKHDTHWNAVGSTLGSEQLAVEAAPGVWDQLDLTSTSASRQGDLAGLIDVDWVVEYDEMTPTLSGLEPTVTVEPISISGRPLVSYDSPARPELSSVATAIIHDSFGLFFRNKLGPLFEEATFLPTFSHPIPDAARPFVVSSDQIAFEIAERNVLRDFIGTGTAGHLAAALADDFAQTPVTFERDEDVVVFDVPVAGLGALNYLIVETSVPGTVVIDDLNTVAIGADEGAWPNEITPDATRYGFEIMDPNANPVIELIGVNVTGAFVITIDQD